MIVPALSDLRLRAITLTLAHLQGQGQALAPSWQAGAEITQGAEIAPAVARARGSYIAVHCTGPGQAGGRAGSWAPQLAGLVNTFHVFC